MRGGSRRTWKSLRRACSSAARSLRNDGRVAVTTILRGALLQLGDALLADRTRDRGSGRDRRGVTLAGLRPVEREQRDGLAVLLERRS